MKNSRKADQPSFSESVLGQTLVFRAGVERFGLRLASVIEVLEISTDPIVVPGAPDWLSGIINHHNRVIPVVRMDLLLQVEPGEPGNQFMLVELQNEIVALQVDQIESLEEVRSEGPSIRGRCRAWLRGSLLTLLETEMLIQTIHSRLTGAGLDAGGFP